MNLSIPKISVGKSNSTKKSLFDFHNSNSTTFSFGMLQPLFCKAVEPNTSLSILCHNFVRFASMHSPTFGGVSYRTYKSFVPASDLFEPYDDFKAQTPYNNGSITSYVPQLEPNITIASLSKLLLFHRSVFSIYQFDIEYEDGSYDLRDALPSSSFNSLYEDLIQDIDNNPQLNILNNCLINPQQTSGGEYLYFRTGNDAVTVNGADFIIYFTVSNTGTGGTETTTKYLACFKLDWAGQQLYKALIGCGFQVNFIDSTRISLLPFCAYYKAYYDMFYVQRNSNWNNTATARLMRYLANHPEYISVDAQVVEELKTLLFGTLNEIGTTYYSCDPDYVSAHTRDLSSQQPSMYVGYAQDAASVEQVGYAGDATDQVRILNDGDDTLQGLSRVALQLLNKLSVRINKNTAFGRRLDLILKNLYGARYHHAFRTNRIGSQITNCQIGDIMSMADTHSGDSGAVLGEYAGRGIGKSDENSRPDHFTTDTWGYVIIMSCIVPDAGYCQALDADLTRISKDDQFQAEFDAVGLEASRKSYIFGDYSVCVPDPDNANHFADFSGTFGFIPRYTSKKIVTNKVNGLLSLRSVRNSFLGYTLDRFLTPPDVVDAGLEYSGGYRNNMGVYNSLLAGTAWRYLCANGVTSNFNRIFYNNVEHQSGRFGPETDIYDNFIVHNFIDVKANAPMLSISDSFDTDAFENDTLDVEKA